MCIKQLVHESFPDCVSLRFDNPKFLEIVVERLHAYQTKGKITENAGSLVQGLNTMSWCKSSKRWQEKQMERMKDGKLN